MRDDFYRLTKDQEAIMRECKELALNFRIERKDNMYIRQREDISFDDILKIFSDNSDRMHWVFIKRKPENNYVGHHVKQEDGSFKKYSTYYEVGGCTMGHQSGRDYFLFVYLTEEDGDSIVSKYGLNLL